MTTPYEEDPSSDEPFFYASLNHDDPALVEPFLIDIPSGGTLGLFETPEQQEHNEAEISASLLRAGDFVAFEVASELHPAPSYTYEVTSADWNDIGVLGGYSPRATITGKLVGDVLPKDIQGKSAIFGGSGWGGPAVVPDAITTGRSPYFYVEGLGEYQAPMVDYFEVFRPDDQGDLRPSEPNQLASEVKSEIPEHYIRLDQVDELMSRFGFKNFDFRNPSQSTQNCRCLIDGYYVSNGLLAYNDERYTAHYQAGMAQGNRLAILDRQTAVWSEFKYFGWKNHDVLQVAMADLSGHNLDLPPGSTKTTPEKVFWSGRLVEEHRVSQAGVAITTHTTSGTNGFSAINYRPDAKETVDILRVPGLGEGQELFSPDIQLHRDGSIRIPLNAPNNMLNAKYPGLLDRLRNNVGFSMSSGGPTTLNLAGKSVQLRDPEAEIASLYENLPMRQQQEAAGDQTKRAQRAGRTVVLYDKKSNDSPKNQ